MKKLSNYLFVAIAALTMVFTSCSDDESTPAPAISFLNDITEGVVAKGGSITIAGSITSESGLKQVKYFQVTDAGRDQLTLVDKFDDKNLYQFQYTLNNIQEDMTLEVEATDKDNNTSSRNFFITVQGTVVGIKTYTLTLGAQKATLGSSFASIDGTVLKQVDAIASSNKVDFMYFYGASNKATIASPSDSDAQSVYTWIKGSGGFVTINETKFFASSMTPTEFDAVTNATGIVISGTASSAQNNLSVGDVLVFKTASTSANPEKSGLAKVVAINNAADSGTIELSVKVSE